MTTFDLDALLDGVVLDAAVDDGRDPALLAASSGAARYGEMLEGV